LGQSPARPGGRDPLTKAGELNALLDQLGETRPVILVGHSNGALYVEAFARLWPERAAGLLYVNGVGSDARNQPLLLADLAEERRAANLAVTAGRLGLAGLVADRLAGPMGLRGAAALRKRAGLMSLAGLAIARDEDRAIIPGLDAVSRLPALPSQVPVAVIAGAEDPDSPLARAWRSAEVAAGQGAAQAWVLDMPGATHVSPLTRDRAYVTVAVSWLRSLSPDPDIGH
jgi:pimeloyl-ACP methyl ester carboxylesterase